MLHQPIKEYIIRTKFPTNWHTNNNLICDQIFEKTYLQNNIYKTVMLNSSSIDSVVLVRRTGFVYVYFGWFNP